MCDFKTTVKRDIPVSIGFSGRTPRIFMSAFGALALRFCSLLAVATAMSETSVTGSAVLGKGDLMSRRRVKSCSKFENQISLRTDTHNANLAWKNL